MIGQLALIVLVVGDLDRSVRFYRDLLGLAVVVVHDRFTDLDAGNIRLSLHAAGDDVGPNATAGCSLGFVVEDVERATAGLRMRGVRVAREPYRNEFGDVFAVVLDPDGYRIQLLQV